METREERLAREQKHFKNKEKKAKKGLGSKLRRAVEEETDKNWKNHILDELEEENGETQEGLE